MKPIESKRVALDRKIVLRFPDFDGFVTEFAANLSMTGMFVRSQEPQRAGTPVAFELRLEDGAPLVRGSGWVVWSRARSELPDRPAGMGIEFTELDHKSRRLVRWMILNQLPEGEKPYQVHSANVGGGAGSGAARRGTAGGSWRVPVVAGALFAALAALILWRGFGVPPAVEERAAVGLPGTVLRQEPAPEVRGNVSADARSKAVTAEVAVGRESDSGKPSDSQRAGPGDEQRAAERAVVAGIEDAVKSWAAAWSDQDVDRYLEHYASDFEAAGGLSRERWRDQRRRRVSAPESIRVAVARLEATIESDHEARVSFLQTYRSDGYADTVDKVLDLVLEQGVWKIRREASD